MVSADAFSSVMRKLLVYGVVVSVLSVVVALIDGRTHAYANYGEDLAVQWCSEGYQRAGANWFSTEGSGSDRVVLESSGSEWVNVTFYTKLRNCSGGSYSGAYLDLNFSYIGANVSPESANDILYRDAPPATAGSYGPIASTTVQFRRSWLVANALSCASGGGLTSVWEGQFDGGFPGDIRIDRCSIDVIYTWSVSGRSYIQLGSNTSMSDPIMASAPYFAGRQTGTITALPGQRLWWDHNLHNDGPDNMERTVFFEVNKTGFSNGWNSIGSPSSNASGVAGSYFVREYALNVRPYTIYDVTQDDVGNTLCQRISWRDRAWNDGSWGSSEYACASVPYRYSLTPATATDLSGSVESESVIQITPSVQNSGPTKSKDTQWQVTRVIVSPSTAIPNEGGGSSAAAPCGTYFQPASGSCATIASGSSVFNANGANLGGAALSSATTTMPSVTDTVGDYPVGTKICYGLSVTPRSDSSNDWQHSRLTCLTVSVSPKLQIWGGDLIVGRSVDGSGLDATAFVQTSLSRKLQAGEFVTYGSWTEYGVFAPSSIQGMSSQSSLNSGSTLSPSERSRLTFANLQEDSTTCNGSPFGCYEMSGGTIPPVGGQFAAESSTPATFSLAGIDKNKVYGPSGALPSITINGGNLGPNEWLVLNFPNQTVTIDGNLTYDSTTPLTALAQIPQLIIIAKEINIAASVTQIDAWLVASGSITTCSDKGTASQLDGTSLISPPDAYKLTSNDCNQPLTINGPVMASKLYLRRTGGSGTGLASGDPAEIINLRPDAYLWAKQYVSQDFRIRTVLLDELPPRF